MKRRGSIVSYTAEEMGRLPDRTNWAKIDAMTPEEIKRLADEERAEWGAGWVDGPVMIGLPPDVEALLRPPVKKQALKLRIDHDVVQWFRKTGKGYQTRMNNALRFFMNTSRPQEERAVAKLPVAPERRTRKKVHRGRGKARSSRVGKSNKRSDAR